MEIKDFRDLEIYKIACEIIKLIYQIVEYLPPGEKYISVRHLKESGQSMAANIAEAWGRFHFKDRLNFLYNSRGSLYEVQHFIDTTKELGLLKRCPKELLDRLDELLQKESVKLNNMIASIHRTLGKSTDEKSTSSVG